MESVLAITRALSDENRIRALLALDDRELCVCQIIELLALAPSTVSKHMTVLKHAGMVQGQKRGRWMYYRQADRQAAPHVRQALDWLRANLSGSTRIKDDQKRLSTILKVDREDLCKKQNAR
jgi:ArsR family transcriptional regulator, arsenate/arsenite/antimonite-responsive transcriptional repressor